MLLPIVLQGEPPKSDSAESAASPFGEADKLYAQVPVGLCYLDSDLRFRHINAWLARINGLSVEGHIGKNIEELPTSVADLFLPRLNQVIETGQPITDSEVVFESPAHPGDPKVFVQSFYLDKSSGGSINGISCVVYDVTERKAAEDALSDRNRELSIANERLIEANRQDAGLKKDALGITRAQKQLDKARQRLQKLALYDIPTGLGNRNLFFSQLEDQIVSSEIAGEEFALLTIGLKGFNLINYRLGHAAGDAVLRHIGLRLSRALTKADQTFRIGGDEFAVLIEPRSGAFVGAVAVAKQLAEQLVVPMEIKGHSCSIGFNVGISTFPQDGRKAETLLQKADAALYEAKEKRQLIAGYSQQSATTVLENLQSEVFQLIYVSTSVRPLTEDELVSLLLESSTRNEQLRITGMLLHKNDHFMGVLEGEEADVRRMFAAIEKDSRHKSVDTLRSGNVLCRDFSNWTMGFENFESSSNPAFTRFLERDFVPEDFAEDLIEAHAILLAFKGDSLTAKYY